MPLTWPLPGPLAPAICLELKWTPALAWSRAWHGISLWPGSRSSPHLLPLHPHASLPEPRVPSPELVLLSWCGTPSPDALICWWSNKVRGSPALDQGLPHSKPLVHFLTVCHSYLLTVYINRPPNRGWYLSRKWGRNPFLEREWC